MITYTIPEFAELLKVKRQTVYNWIKAKQIKTVKTPTGNLRIPQSEVIKFTEIKE